MSASPADRGRAFLDTNVLGYLYDVSSPAKRQRAREVLQMEGPSAAISTQVLAELYVVLTRKLAVPLPEEDAEAVVRDLASLHVVETDAALVLAGVARSRADRLSPWDALVVEAALRAGCRRLLTEDLQDGRAFGGLRVVNPFRASGR